MMKNTKLKHILKNILKEQDTSPTPLTPPTPPITPMGGKIDGDLADPSLDLSKGGPTDKPESTPNCSNVTATLCNSDNYFQSDIFENFECITVNGQTPQIGSYFEADVDSILNPDVLFYQEAPVPPGFGDTEATAVPGCMYNSETGFCEYYQILYLDCGTSNNPQPCYDFSGPGATFYNSSTGEYSGIGDTSVEDFSPMGLEQAYQDTQGSFGPYGGYE